MNFIPPIYYQSVYIYVLLALILILYGKLAQRPNSALLQGSKQSLRPALILATIFAWFVGTRPLHWAFGDMYNYRRIFLQTIAKPFSAIDYSEEWLFDWLMHGCGALSLDYLDFCLIVDILYFGITLIACYRLSKRHTYILFIAVLSAYSFFSYGTNGVRNGLACAITLVALSFVSGSFKDRIVAAALCFAAYSIHHATALPAVAMFVSYYVIKGPKWCIAFWILSILISIVAGSTMEAVFAGMGFDDRLSHYIQGNQSEATMQEFSQTGFRWDFLLYSSMPIILGWYIVMRRKITDRPYIVLLNTYILCNSFWVMINRAAFSNRFAYLSWFMYAIVLIYPLIKIPVYNRQGKALANILLAQIAFTLIMNLLGK